MAETSPTWQIHAGKCFWRHGEEYAVGLLMSALESNQRLLVHLAATLEVYTRDKLQLMDQQRRPGQVFSAILHVQLTPTLQLKCCKTSVKIV